MFIEPRHSIRRTPEECNGQLRRHFTPDGVSGRGPIRTIYMQLLPELRLFVMFETVL